MINNIHFNSYKSFKEIEIELRNLNVLIGANGAGKSNFISFFEFLHNIFNQNLQNYTTENGGSDNILYFGTKESNQLFCTMTFNYTNLYEFLLKPTQSNNFYFDYEASGFNVNYQSKSKSPDWRYEPWIKGNKESLIKDAKTEIQKSKKIILIVLLCFISMIQAEQQQLRNIATLMIICILRKTGKT